VGQGVELGGAQIQESASSLSVVLDGKVEDVKFGEDGFLTVNQDTAKSTEAEGVFVGYGLTVPEAHYDDLAGQNLKGKIAVLVTGGPADMAGGPEGPHHPPDETRREVHQAGGAGGG